MLVGLFGLHKINNFGAVHFFFKRFCVNVKISVQLGKLWLLRPVFLTALSYSPNVGAGIRATSPLHMKISANRYMSSVEPLPTIILFLVNPPKWLAIACRSALLFESG